MLKWHLSSGLQKCTRPMLKSHPCGINTRMPKLLGYCSINTERKVGGNGSLALLSGNWILGEQVSRHPKAPFSCSPHLYHLNVHHRNNRDNLDRVREPTAKEGGSLKTKGQALWQDIPALSLKWSIQESKPSPLNLPSHDLTQKQKAPPLQGPQLRMSASIFSTKSVAGFA